MDAKMAKWTWVNIGWDNGLFASKVFCDIHMKAIPQVLTHLIPDKSWLQFWNYKPVSKGPVS